ncbi:DNA recombination protein RmuC [Candidatus Woesearchaeota archaeon]|nr:DNA recombination protein RmuC [Candidatus Woesearchaeota archaeon]
MTLFETIVVILILLLIGLVIHLIRKIKPIEEPKTHGEIMSRFAEIKTIIDEREKKHEKIEEKRDEFLKQNTDNLSKELTNFTRLISGTKKSGNIGENMLKEVLHPFIKSGKIMTNLHIDNKVVEFAWKITNNKFVPIDSKFPDIIDLYKDYFEAKEEKEQQKYKREIINKLRKSIDEAKKYKNKRNTTDKVIIAIPDAIFELIPEINSDFESTGVIVCGYSFVTYISAHIEREYLIIVESGEIGEYRELLDKIMSLIYEIKKKTETIDKGVNMVGNANIEIKKSVIEAESSKPKQKKKIVVGNK